jgi:hypothetical protein
MLPATKFQTAFQEVTTGNVASTFFNIFQGRCTFAAICFSIAGVYGWLHGKDLTSFALFVTAVQGLLVLHSAKEDLHEQRMAEMELRKMKDGDTIDLEKSNGTVQI